MADYIPVNEPLLDGNEKAYLSECIDSGWISSEGPFVKRFEKLFAASVNRKHAIAVTNGSAALDASIAALGIGEGDEVILPTFTIISCISQIIRSGATPVLVDSELDTWNMDVSQIEQKISAKTKAILAVHIYGLPVDLQPLLKLADKYGLRVIEDAAEVYGQTYYGQPCGSFGDLSTFSFYPNKHLTTGEGGMIVTDDPELAEKCRSLRNLCFESERRFVHEQLGWNLRMSNLQAAVGVAQLERLDMFVERKREMGRRYNELLAEIPTVTLPVEQTDYADNIYWVYGLLLDDSIAMDALDVILEMGKRGVGCRPFFFPMHLQPVLKRLGLFENESFPVAEKLSSRGLYIPSGLALTETQAGRVAETLREVLK